MRIRHPLLPLAATLTFLVAACGPAGPPQMPPPAGPALGMAGMQWTANLQPVGGSGVSGTATVSAGDGADQTRVTITVAGAQPNSVLPWHIHRGRCGSDQGIHGDGRAYPGLSALAQGSAQLHVVLPVRPPSDGDYMVNVHHSPGRMGTIVACGNLAR